MTPVGLGPPSEKQKIHPSTRAIIETLRKYNLPLLLKMVVTRAAQVFAASSTAHTLVKL